MFTKQSGTSAVVVSEIYAPFSHPHYAYLVSLCKWEGERKRESQTADGQLSDDDRQIKLQLYSSQVMVINGRSNE